MLLLEGISVAVVVLATVACLQELTYKKLPKLYKHLQAQQCEMSIIATDWFLCLFATTLPSEVCPPPPATSLCSLNVGSGVPLSSANKLHGPVSSKAGRHLPECYLSSAAAVVANRRTPICLSAGCVCTDLAKASTVTCITVKYMRSKPSRYLAISWKTYKLLLSYEIHRGQSRGLCCRQRPGCGMPC